MKTILSSSILKSPTAGRMRPRQMEEGHRDDPRRGRGAGWADGAAHGGFSAGLRVRGTGSTLAKAASGRACSAERGKAPGALGGGVFWQRSRGWGGAQAFSGAGPKAGAGVACAARARCGAALPWAPAARRRTRGRGAAVDGREGRRRVTSWALTRCGPSWGFA